MAGEIIRYRKEFVNIAEVGVGVEFPIKHRILLLASTTIPLLANNSYISSIINVQDYIDISISIFSNQNGTLYTQFSPDGTNFDVEHSFSYFANRKENVFYTVKTPYLRITYTNGSQNQSIFRLYIFGKY